MMTRSALFRSWTWRPCCRPAPAAKMEIAMARGGPAWRGYFPVGAELTSGQPDLKEGLYFGAELGDDDPPGCAPGSRCTGFTALTRAARPAAA